MKLRVSHFVLGVAFFAMGCQEDPKTSPVSVYATARALNETTVTIKFSHPIDRDRTNIESITVTNFSERIPRPDETAFASIFKGPME